VIAAIWPGANEVVCGTFGGSCHLLMFQLVREFGTAALERMAADEARVGGEDGTAYDRNLRFYISQKSNCGNIEISKLPSRTFRRADTAQWLSQNASPQMALYGQSLWHSIL